MLLKAQSFDSVVNLLMQRRIIANPKLKLPCIWTGVKHYLTDRCGYRANGSYVSNVWLLVKLEQATKISKRGTVLAHTETHVIEHCEIIRPPSPSFCPENMQPWEVVITHEKDFDSHDCPAEFLTAAPVKNPKWRRKVDNYHEGTAIITDIRNQIGSLADKDSYAAVFNIRTPIAADKKDTFVVPCHRVLSNSISQLFEEVRYDLGVVTYYLHPEDIVSARLVVLESQIDVLTYQMPELPASVFDSFPINNSQEPFHVS